MRILRLLVTLAVFATVAHAQIDLVPKNAQPTLWERFTLRVINQLESPTTEVTLTVPEIIRILGVESPKSGWQFTVQSASDSTPQVIRWTGGAISQGQFDEFAFLGRIAGDARRKELVFPVSLSRADGSTSEWAKLTGEGSAPVVQIVGTTMVTLWGAVGLAGGAFGISILALGLAASKRREA